MAVHDADLMSSDDTKSDRWGARSPGLTRSPRPVRLRAVTEVRGAATFRTSADAYDRHIGRYGPELAAALIAAAGLQPGQRALDVGCGPGA